MNAKEKAHDLVDKYLDGVEITYVINGMFEWVGMDKDEAKQCALISINETIKALHAAETAYALVGEISYWQKVKEELKKL